MCRRSTCHACNKATWWGCGQHVEAVMDAVPAADRCVCAPKVQCRGGEYPPMGKQPA